MKNLKIGKTFPALPCLPFHNSLRHQRRLGRAQNSHCIIGKSQLLNAAQYVFYTWAFRITFTFFTLKYTVY